MKVTGVREFRNNVPKLINGKELVYVTRHGKLAGILLPVGEPTAHPYELRGVILDRVGDNIATHLRKVGMTEAKAEKHFTDWRTARRANRR